jgi:hypothetical protein
MDAYLPLFHSLLTALIPVLSPVLTDLLKRMVNKIPTNLMPIISSLIGALIAVVSNGMSPESVTLGAGGGLMGVGIREVINQNITKKLSKNRIGGPK